MATDFDVAGVTLESAGQWLTGQIWAKHAHDLDTSRCEVAFLNELGDRASYRACLRAVVDLWRRGARGAVVHCCSDMMLARYIRQGAVCAFKEEILWRGQTHPAHRLIIPHAATAAWIKKVSGGVP